MGKAGYVLPLSGLCLEVPTDREGSVLKCTPFLEFCIHTVMSNPYGAGSIDLNEIGGTYSCAKLHPGAADGTGELPKFSTLSGSVPYGKVYGKTGGQVVIKDKGQKVYFRKEDLVPWQKRVVYSQRRWYAQGPAVVSAHSAIEVRRRLKGTPNNSYAGRAEWETVDSQYTLKQGANWMAPLHPANCLWTNKGVNEPLLATTHFELCGQKPEIHSWFCSPLTAYQDSAFANRLGSYVGLSFLHIASSGVIKKPIRQCSIFPCQATPNCGVTDVSEKDKCAAIGYMPENYFEQENPVTGKRPVVNPTWQFMMVETAVFMVGDTIESPRVGTIRHWFINRPYQPQNNPCSEYFYTHYSDLTQYWEFPVLFDTQDRQETIKFNLSGFQVYSTP